MAPCHACPRGDGSSREPSSPPWATSFGCTLTIREESRESWGIAWLDSIGQDLRYGLRQLNRNRGFANLGLFVMKQTISTQSRPEARKLDVLIKINRELAAGLRASAEALDR